MAYRASAAATAAKRARRFSRSALLIALASVVTTTCSANTSPTQPGEQSLRQGEQATDSTPATRAERDTAVGGARESGATQTDDGAPGAGDETRVGGPSESPQSCEDRLDRAQTEAEWTEALAACGWSSSFPTTQHAAIGQDPEYEQLTWDQSSEWWPYRPILHAAQPPVATREVVYAWSEAGGRRASPRSDAARVVVIYERPPVDTTNAGETEIVANGGIVISVLSPAAEAEWSRLSGAERVRVRGVDASQWKFGTDAQQTRVTLWRAGDGTAWIAITSVAHLSDRETVAFIDALVPV